MNSLRLIMRDYLLNAYEVAKSCLGASESGPLGGFVLNNLGSVLPLASDITWAQAVV